MPKKKEDLLSWAKNIDFVLNQINRFLVSSYNLHLDQTYGHPKSWDTWKIHRPAYLRDTSDGAFHKLKVPASSTQPVTLLIGGKILQATSDLSLDVTVSGVGGLRTGLTVASATLYYLYAVNNGGALALIADTNDPSVGVTGYTDWSYLGGFVTLDTSAILTDFSASHGVYLDNGYFQRVTQAGVTQTAKTIRIPKAAKAVYGVTSFQVIGAAGDRTHVSSRSTSDNNNPLIATAATAAIDTFAYGWIPILETQTIYLGNSAAGDTARFDVIGWLEDPSEFR